MATSVHIPKPLLDQVDKKARALQVSRNRLIISALEREVMSPNDWALGFFDRLTPLSSDDARAFDESLAAVRKRRGSKQAPKL